MGGLIIRFTIALTFGYACCKLKIPGGMLVGSIIGVAALSISVGKVYLPPYIKYIAQIISGAFIGSSVERRDIKRLKHLIKPALLLNFSMLSLNISLGFLMHYISPLDLITSFMSCIPGGLSEIPIISAEMGADASKVAVLQFIRMLAGVGLFPILISKIDQDNNKTIDNERVRIFTPTIKNTEFQIQSSKISIQTALVALFSGIIGKLLKIPAGVLLFSMIGVIIFKLICDKAYMPIWSKRFAQVLAGSYIGSSIDYNDVIALKYLVIPAILIVIAYFFTCMIMGKVLNMYFDMDLKEAMLAATPAAASDMALISSDLGVASANLVVLQTIRLITVLSIFPQVISFILTFC